MDNVEKGQLELETKLDSTTLRNGWRSERAFRTGRTLVRVALALGILATLVDVKYEDRLQILADGAFLVGCLVSIFLTEKRVGERYFYWIPAYAGLFMSTAVSTWETGGINSPFLGLYLALLFICALVIQTRFSPLSVLVFTVSNLLGWSLIETAIPKETVHLSPAFSFLSSAILLVGLAALAYAFLKTESELSTETVRHYDELIRVRSQLANEEAASSAKTTFLANISHELRTPIGAILGFSNLILDKSDHDPEREEFVQSTRRNALKLSSIVEDLIDVSKVEAGGIEISLKPTYIHEVLTDAVISIREAASQKGVRVSCAISGAVPSQIEIDGPRVSQIVSNMIANAVKYTDIGDISVTMDYTAQGRNNGNLTITIKDTGRGMGAEEKQNLFKPFGRGDIALNREFGGTGLGLHLSRKLANLMGGELSLISSEKNVGSVFSFFLPTTAVAPSMATHNAVAHAAESSNLTGQKVLVVDDNVDNQLIICKYLKGAGADVVCAADGLSGIQHALQTAYDVVLMDIQMPILDGLKATVILRQKNFKAPIIALTAHAMKEDRDRCLSSGFNAYLTKPIDRKLLLSTLADFKKATPPVSLSPTFPVGISAG